MKWQRIIITALICVSTILCVQKNVTAATDTPLQKQIKVQFTSADQLNQFRSLGLDIWKIYADHVVAAVDYEKVAEIEQMGFRVEVISDDAWNVLKPKIALPPSKGTFGSYHTNAEVEAIMRAMESSGVAKVYDIGDSIQGRDIWALRISDNPTVDEDEVEPSVLFVGCHHAREWISVEVSLYIADYLTANYASNPEIQSMVDNQQVWVVPVLNPDGYVYTHTTNRGWRKNRRNNGGGDYGVDLNRNYGYNWGYDNDGSSSDPGASDYRGPSAFSEPETRALRDLCLEHEFRSMITYHSYGGEVACTWGYTADPPPDYCRDRHIADVMETVMNEVHDAGYTSPNDYIYRTNGDTTDWTYGIFRMPSITIELRPTGTSGGSGFELPENQIIPTCEENLPAALYFITWNQADLNSDYIVNLNDFAIFSSFWLESGCNLSNLCCDGADIFGSDTVDTDDLVILADQWLAQSVIDSSIPSPDPITFSSVPAATGDSSIAMTASVATDFSGVQYYFTCTAGGGNDSGWQDSRTYEDTGLTPATQYTYTVIVRDKSVAHNQTAASDPASATTDAPDLTAPTPNPMTWNTSGNGTTSTTVSMRATTASDSSSVEYYFTCTADGGNDSGWQDSTAYTDNGLTPGTSYTYTVMARDKSSNQNQTLPSVAPRSATTEPAPVGPAVWTDKAVYAPGEAIVVYFANAEGNWGDWVALFLPTTPSTNYDEFQWMYTDGTHSGTAGIYNGTLYFDGLSAGSYQARFHFNDGYTIEASCDITVE